MHPCQTFPTPKSRGFLQRLFICSAEIIPQERDPNAAVEGGGEAAKDTQVGQRYQPASMPAKRIRALQGFSRPVKLRSDLLAYRFRPDTTRPELLPLNPHPTSLSPGFGVLFAKVVAVVTLPREGRGGSVRCVPDAGAPPYSYIFLQLGVLCVCPASVTLDMCQDKQLQGSQ